MAATVSLEAKRTPVFSSLAHSALASRQVARTSTLAQDGARVLVISLDTRLLAPARRTTMLRQLACPLGAGLCSVLRTVWRLGLVQNCQHVLYGSGRWEPSDDCPSIRCFRGQRDFDCIAIRRPASGVKPRAPR